VTRRLAKPASTSSARHSRVKASTMLSTRIDRPAARTSCAKSNARCSQPYMRRTNAHTVFALLPLEAQPRFAKFEHPLVVHTRASSLQQISNRRYPYRGFSRARQTSCAR
jgi:hypothetical protein